jgi:hypothetical protein
MKRPDQGNLHPKLSRIENACDNIIFTNRTPKQGTKFGTHEIVGIIVLIISITLLYNVYSVFICSSRKMSTGEKGESDTLHGALYT